MTHPFGEKVADVMPERQPVVERTQNNEPGALFNTGNIPTRVCTSLFPEEPQIGSNRISNFQDPDLMNPAGGTY